MSKFQPTGYGSQPATPATSVWLVIDNLPGEDDEQRKKLEELIEELKKVVVETARDKVGWPKVEARAGIAKTGKLRVFVEQT